MLGVTVTLGCRPAGTEELRRRRVKVRSHFMTFPGRRQPDPAGAEPIVVPACRGAFDRAVRTRAVTHPIGPDGDDPTSFWHGAPPDAVSGDSRDGSMRPLEAKTAG